MIRTRLGRLRREAGRSTSREDAEALLSELAGKPMKLPGNTVATGGPSTCPACGSANVMWGCDPEQVRREGEIHSLVWHETEWLADSFMCRECHAGWIEPDEPETDHLGQAVLAYVTSPAPPDSKYA